VNVAVRPDTLNIISVCTGGGGLDLGVELAIPNARPVVLVEREAFAIGHLVSAMQEGLMAPAPIWSDVTTFDGRPWCGLVDGFIGGIPCQPHSFAGRREGSDDERDLWSDARRIIVQARPWFVLIENVRGMLSAKPGLDPGALRVWRDLRRLGFSVEAGLFTASEVGASHERERIFILAVADTDGRQRAGRPSVWGEAVGRRSYDELAGSSAGLRQLADAGRECDERWGRTGDVLRSAGTGEGQRDQWERHGYAADDCRNDMAGSGIAGLEGGEPKVDARPGIERATLKRDSRALVHAERTERRPHAERGHELDRHHGGWDQAPSRLGEPGSLVVNPSIVGWRKGRAETELRSGRDSIAFAGGLFPPGPSDLLRWQHTLENSPELEPAFRRVADGLASRLDIARVDRLRMLGNGVVCLEAAYAIRTLVTRLAEGGAPGSARLVCELWDDVMKNTDEPHAAPRTTDEVTP
jgi:DNA (cytosine-5)-methyltransferase 1